jgi:excisionase family DNA binding protein
MESVLTPKEVAKILNVSMATIHRYLNDIDNPIPHIRLSSSCIRILNSDLVKWLELFRDKKL